MLSEAQRFWDAIVGKVRQVAKEESSNTFRCERYEVTTAPDGNRIGVTLPLGTTEIFLPYSQEVASATVGSQVLVVWWGSMSNAKVYYYANGYNGGSGGSSPSDIYKVGAIYISADPTSPAQLFGGTWEQIKDTFLLAAGDAYAAGDSGGEATHTLTTDEMAAHTHGSKSLSGFARFRRYGSSTPGTDIAGVQTTSGIVAKTTYTWSGSHGQINSSSTSLTNPILDQIDVNATHEHDSVGGGAAHNNMPPYLAVFMWKKIGEGINTGGNSMNQNPGAGLPSGGEAGNVLLRTADGAEWGALDYEDLNNKPRIEGVVLVGDKTFDELHMSRITNSELETMLAI